MYVLMKILESSPKRYNRGISIITMGRLNTAYDRLTSGIHSGMRVLDIGCGTGLLTILAAEKGAVVKGIDINPEMLEIAQKRLKGNNTAEELEKRVKFCEMGAAELGGEKEDCYDAVISGLCFSELSSTETDFTLRELKRIVKPQGILLIADETIPENFFKRVLHIVSRIPLLFITYIFTGTTTRSLRGFPKKLELAGFRIDKIRTNKMESFMEITATNTKRGN